MNSPFVESDHEGVMITPETIIHLADKALGKFAERSGSIFYSSFHTLKKGDFYFMGLNPGGDETQDGHQATILESIYNHHQLSQKNPRYSSYCDEDWGRSNHQARVCEIANALGQDIRDIFSANAIFVRSINASGIARDFTELKDACLGLHEYFLSIVQPRVIVCLGNGEKLSPFSILRDHFKPKSVLFVRKPDFRDGKYFDAKISLSEYTEAPPFACRVIGVPHPSRFKVTAELKNFLSRMRMEFP